MSRRERMIDTRKCRNWQTSKTKDLVFIANVWVQVPSSALHHKYSWRLCRSGGIGRRAGFRCLWSQDRVGSSPISCIIFFLLLRMPELRIRLAVRHRMSLLFRLGSSSFFLLCNFFQHNRIFFCSYFVEKSILL